MWFSMMWTLIDNGTRHRSGQNLMWTHSAASRVSTTFEHCDDAYTVMTRIPLSIRVLTTLNHIPFVN